MSIECDMEKSSDEEEQPCLLADLEPEKKPRKYRKSYYVIELVNVTSSISAINKFMILHPEFFKTNISRKFIYHDNNQIYSIYTEPLWFKDSIHKINGYITTELEGHSYIMRVHINKNNKSKECYIKQIEEYVNHQTKYGNNVELNYYKILSDTIIKHCYYNETIEQWAKDVMIVQNEFFSPHKKYLFSIINDKSRNNGIGNTANSWNNLILYGAPGLGKSSCIYRISMMLKLSILSVDLSLYLNKKRELYSMFHGQEFMLPNVENTKEPAIMNSIIVLEEFDHAINKLLDIENIFKYKDILKREYLNMKNEEIKSRANNLIDEYVVKNSRNTEATANVSANADRKPRQMEITSESNYDDFMKAEMLNDGFDMQNNQVFDKARQTVLKKRDFDNELCGINAELNSIIKSMDDDNKSNILRLSDMLELFQGPVPIKNRIIIATTNNFEKIKDALPALFRSGRMSPIHFDHLDWVSLNELCQYYFQRTLTCEPRVINIPTSQIIELAIKHVLAKKTFEEFESELITALM